MTCSAYDFEWRKKLKKKENGSVILHEKKFGIVRYRVAHNRVSLVHSYFIPEDGDTESYPNVFLAPKPRQQGMPPSLGQVKESFPLPGRYHFRFKSPLVPGGDREKGGMAVWMDCVHDSQAIPTWRNSIIAKVSRVAVDDDDDDDDDFPSSSHGAPPVQQHQAPAPAPPRHTESSEPLLDVFDGQTSGSAPASMPSSHHSSAADLLGSAPPVPQAPTSGGSLLDMDGPHYNSNHGNQHTSSVHHDFMGMTAPVTPAQPPAGYRQQQQPTPQQQYPPQQQQAPPQQRATPQQPPPPQRNSNAFDSFSTAKGGNDQGPFGDLNWS